MQDMQDMIDRLNQSGRRLSKGHRKIAQYIVDHYDKAVFMTASRLGESVGVSESTVVRFASAMGYEGYPQLQRSLQELVSHRLTANQRFEMSTEIAPGEALPFVLKSDMQNLRATLEELDVAVFEDVVHRLLSAKAIYVMGLRSAAPLAQFMGYYLNYIFPNVHLVSSGATDVFEEISQLTRDDVLVGISFPRYSTRTLEAMRFAKHCDAQVVAITDGPMSPLHDIADACLTARTDMASFVDSLAAPLSVINALLVSLGLHRKEALTEHFRKLETIWDTYQVYLEEEGIMHKIIIIGGGAGGMMAALFAARAGANVTLLERNEKLGKKVYITGKGRCNVTNDCTQEEFLKEVAHNPRFLYSALSFFSPQDMMALLEDAGCPVVVQRGRRVFPATEKASDVNRTMARLLQQAGVDVRLNTRVQSLCMADGHITGVTLFGGERLTADAVVLATGGKSYPMTGSTGDGYTLAESAGHTIQPAKAVLSAVETAAVWPSELQGLSLRNVTLTLKKGKKTLYSELGEMLFTHFGISGPLTLEMSCHLPDDLREADVTLNLKPGLNAQQLDARLQRELEAESRKQLRNVMPKLLPGRLAEIFPELCGVDGGKQCCQITRAEREKLGTMMQSLPLPLKALSPLAEAIVTRGGVTVKEISPATMESKLLSGLYFAGEVMDVDAHTGGYNLQIAWSTGALAGQSAAEASN